MAIGFARRLWVDGAKLGRPADTAGYEAAVLHELRQIELSNTGLCVLHSLHVGSDFVRIVPYREKDANASSTPLEPDKAYYRGRPVRDGMGAKSNPPSYGLGFGSEVTVEFTPWRFAVGDRAATLLHELEHAAEQVHGAIFTNPLGWSFDTTAEFDAILVENIYRSEKGLHRRRSHANVSDKPVSEMMVPEVEGYQRLLKSFRARMPFLSTDLAKVNAPWNPLRKGAHGYVGVGGAVEGYDVTTTH